ncbi:hypothetical protein B0T13DRAFT_226856 [Neurospora crassa]|nr:hypothetical protein B0T13DRAFT_226856 [Neurospora crassa]
MKDDDDAEGRGVVQCWWCWWCWCGDSGHPLPQSQSSLIVSSHSCSFHHSFLPHSSRSGNTPPARQTDVYSIVFASTSTCHLNLPPQPASQPASKPASQPASQQAVRSTDSSTSIPSIDPTLPIKGEGLRDGTKQHQHQHHNSVAVCPHSKSPKSEVSPSR